MKTIRAFLFPVLAILAISSASRAGVGGDCSFNGKKLWGKVKVVEHFADFKVKVTSSFRDLRVKPVSAFADSCGEWQFVESFPDFTIQYVESFPDFTIEMVDSFPGLP